MIITHKKKPQIMLFEFFAFKSPAKSHISHRAFLKSVQKPRKIPQIPHIPQTWLAGRLTGPVIPQTWLTGWLFAAKTPKNPTYPTEPF